MPAPLGLVKIPYQWPSFSAGVTFASASLSLPDLDNLQRQVAMAIRIQPNQIWLPYLIKCSLKRKSHYVWKEERHSQGAIMFSGPVLPVSHSGARLSFARVDWLPHLFLFFLIAVVMESTEILGVRGWKGVAMANVNQPFKRHFYSSDPDPTALTSVRIRCIMRPC